MTAAKLSDPEQVRQQEQSMPRSVAWAGRSRPQDIANAALFLASEDASFATGAMVPVTRHAAVREAAAMDQPVLQRFVDGGARGRRAGEEARDGRGQLIDEPFRGGGTQRGDAFQDLQRAQVVAVQ